jgi:hypothetical protein
MALNPNGGGGGASTQAPTPQPVATSPTPVTYLPNAPEQTTFAASGDPYSPAEINGPSGTRPATVPPNYVWNPTANGSGAWVPGDPRRGAPPAKYGQTTFGGPLTNAYAADGTDAKDPTTGQPLGGLTADGKPVIQSNAVQGQESVSSSTNPFVALADATGIPQAVGGALNKAKVDATSLANSLDPSQSADAQASRDFGSQLRGAYSGFQPAAAPTLNTTTLNADQATQRANINAEQGIANGTTKTAADALLQQGTDQAAKNAAGLAAQYSAQNPGMALRQGLAASNNAYATAAAPAAQLKSQEQQTALGNIGQQGASLAGQDTTAASADQNAKVTTNAQNNTQTLGLGTLAANQTNAPLNTDIAGAQAKGQLYGSLASSGGGLIAALSDKRAKKNIKRKSLADAMADNVHGITYEYKPGMGEESGKRAGTLADELMKAIPGAVKPDARGMKRVDTGHVALASAGLLAELTRRIKKLEKRA